MSGLTPHRQHLLGWLVVAVVVVALVMGTGPGILLVNRPTMLFGLPLVYVWGILWYFVLCLAALVAYFGVWRDTSDSAGRKDKDPPCP